MKRFRRIRRKGKVKSVKDLLNNYLFKLPSGDRFKIFYLREIWDTLMPEKLSDITRPEEFKNDVLVINSKTHEWANELNLLKRDILKKIKGKMTELGIKIKDIYFKQGTV